jgi:hypothetical protein
MSRCVRIGRLALWAVLLLSVLPPADAHVLDGYLQTARVALETDCVAVELDLTPGIAVAAEVFAAIDLDRDGRISEAERHEYARVVLADVVLELDGRPQPLQVTRADFPAWDEMAAGSGAIRLEARAPTGAGAPGSHRLRFRNDHRPAIGVYLANALQPETSRIRITGQQRDPLQHELALDFTTSSGAAGGLTWLMAAGCGLLALAWYRRRV